MTGLWVLRVGASPAGFLCCRCLSRAYYNIHTNGYHQDYPDYPGYHQYYPDYHDLYMIRYIYCNMKIKYRPYYGYQVHTTTYIPPVITKII